MARSSGREQVEPRGQQRLDRAGASRDPTGRRVGTQRPSSCRRSPSSISIDRTCWTKSGLPLRRGDDPVADFVREGRVAEQMLDDALAAPRRRAARARSTWSVGPLDQSGRCSERSGPAAQSNRSGASDAVVSRLRDQVEKCRLGPVDVFEDHDEGLSSAEARTASGCPRRPRRVGSRSLRQPDGRGHACDRVLAAASGDSDASFARASSGVSSSRILAASRTISTNGQKVMPRPYGRQRPRSTRAPG